MMGHMTNMKTEEPPKLKDIYYKDCQVSLRTAVENDKNSICFNSS